MSVTFFAIIPPRLWQMSTIGLGSPCVRQHAFGCPKLIKTGSYFSVHINFFEQYPGIVLQSAVVFSNKNVGGVSICPDTRSRQTCGKQVTQPECAIFVSPGFPWVAVQPVDRDEIDVKPLFVRILERNATSAGIEVCDNTEGWTR
jgi:hypothetical protein